MSHPAPASPAPRSKAWLWILVAVVAVPALFFGGCAAIIAVATRNSPEELDTSTEWRPSAGIGHEVRDGQFAFVVQSVQPAVGRREPRPRGQSVVVTITVRNIGGEPHSFLVQNQKLIDAQGREYAADTMAAMTMNPGLDVAARLPFDVPADVWPTELLLRDSAQSAGVTVRLD